MKLLLYCTKAKPYLRDYRGKAIYNRFVISPNDRPFTSDDTQPTLNGKIVAECDFEVERIEHQGLGLVDIYETSLDEETLCFQSCLSDKELHKYLNGKNGYAIHIKNLHIFDKPKELNKCMSIKTFENEFVSKTLSPKMISKAPQNMMKAKMWVDCKEYGIWKDYILISIRPEWLCKILNGEKTIEVRKKVLKEMLG